MPSPSREYLAAVCQMTSTADSAANLAQAESLVHQAADFGAQLVVLPELFNCLGDPQSMLASAEAESGPKPGMTSDGHGPTWQRMSQLAKQRSLVLLAGSIPERSSQADMFHNTSVLFDADGRELARYRKIHLFDVDVPGRVTYCESNAVLPGEEVVCVETALGRLGLAICYDLRFPELFRKLADQGAELLLIPSAFTRETGRDHWQPLLQARAIENQVYVLAANQFGQHTAQLTTLGRSMIIDPWGTVLATAADGAGIALAAISRDRILEIRARVPALAHRRLR